MVRISVYGVARQFLKIIIKRIKLSFLKYNILLNMFKTQILRIYAKNTLYNFY